MKSASVSWEHREAMFHRRPRLCLVLAAGWHEGVMESSWGLALWEARKGHWWRCSLSGSRRTRTDRFMERSWGFVPWRQPMRDYWWKYSPVAARDLTFWRCQYLVITTKKWSQLEPRRQVVFTAVGRAGKATQAIYRIPEDCEWISDNGTLDYLYCWHLVLLGSDGAHSLLKKVFNFDF